jgi:hypothetical protein
MPPPGTTVADQYWYFAMKYGNVLTFQKKLQGTLSANRFTLLGIARRSNFSRRLDALFLLSPSNAGGHRGRSEGIV